MQSLDLIQDKLRKFSLDDVAGSPFDNPFSVFLNDTSRNNLVVLGTNGNITDAVKTNSEWVQARIDDITYSHLRDGDWGNSSLQSQLIKLPNILNTCFKNDYFSEDRMILSNGLLLASGGVDDIGTQIKHLKTYSSAFNNKKELVAASIDFLKECTLFFAKPKVIFAYGNSETKDSAWKYIKEHFNVVNEISPIKKTTTSSYKFCIIEHAGDLITVIGSPHMSYPSHWLNSELIERGLSNLGAL